MKQIYFFVMAALLSIGLAANAETFTFVTDFEWDNPGALKFTYNYQVQNVGNSTSLHFVLQEEGDEGDDEADVAFGLKSMVIEPQNGYAISRVYYLLDDGSEKEITTWNKAKYSVNIGTYRGKKIFITTEKPEPDATLTLKVLNTPKSINYVGFNGSGTEYDKVTKGDNVLSFFKAKDSKISISVNGYAYVLDADGEKEYSKVYSLTRNGQDVTANYDWGTYTFDIAPDDVIVIQPLEVDPDAEVNPEDLESTVTFDLDIPDGMFKNIFYDGKFYTSLSDLDNNQLKVTRGDSFNLNFNDDFVISEATYAGETIDFTDTQIRLTPTKSGTLYVKAAVKDYGTRTITAYVVCPEGVVLANGNFLSNEIVDFSSLEGEVVEDALSVPGVEPVAAFEIPAGQLRKYTFTVSQKYSNLSVKAAKGYWLKAVRKWDGSLSTELDAQFTNSSVLIVAKKIQNDTKAKVYIDKAIDPTTVQLRPDRRLGASENIRFTETGFNEIEFDSEFIPYWNAICTDGEMVDNSGESPKPLYLATVFGNADMTFSGQDMAWDGENFIYTGARLNEGGLLMVYPQLIHNVKITRERFAFAEGAYMGPQDVNGEISGLTVDKKTTFKAYALTKFYIYGDPSNTTVTLDGEPVEFSYDEGSFAFYSDGDNQVVVKFTGEDPSAAVFTPAAGSDAESLDEITIAFPNASDVTLRDDFNWDEVSFQSSDKNTWAPIYASFEQVEDAEVPTFKYTVTAGQPYQPLSYTIMIPADAFTFNWTGDCAAEDFTASWTLTPAMDEISYQFEPQCDLSTANTGWGVQVGLVFEDSQMPRIVDESKIIVKWNGSPVSDFMTTAEANYLIFMLYGSDYNNVAGEVTIEILPGAVTVNGVDFEGTTHTWNVVDPVEVKVAHGSMGINEEDGTFKYVINFSGDEVETVEIFNEKGAVLQEEGYSYTQTGKIEKVEPQKHAQLRASAEDPGHTFEITFPAPTKNSNYTLTVREGTFTINGAHASDEISHTMNYNDVVTGIFSISVDREGHCVIYDLNGRRIDTDLQSLQKGIYVIDGKKVIR